MENTELDVNVINRHFGFRINVSMSKWISRLTARVLFWMASDTSVVQKMEEAQMTTWPGHCNTHSLLGTYKKHHIVLEIFHTAYTIRKNVIQLGVKKTKQATLRTFIKDATYL